MGMTGGHIVPLSNSPSPGICVTDSNGLFENELEVHRVREVLNDWHDRACKVSNCSYM